MKGLTLDRLLCTMTEKILCVIGARGGSQGVPGKNIMPMQGKPLIAWTIERALSLGDILSDIVVSTDDPAIARVALDLGAKVPFVRPAQLASSTAGKFQVWKHALKASEDSFHRSYDVFLDMDCTNPLLEAEDLRRFLDAFREARRSGSTDGMFTVCAAHRSPYFNLVEEDELGFLHLSKSLSSGPVVRRQASPRAWDIVAGFYIFTTSYIHRAETLLEGAIKPFEVPREKSFDIDDAFDVEIVSWILEKRRMEKEKSWLR